MFTIAGSDHCNGVTRSVHCNGVGRCNGVRPTNKCCNDDILLLWGGGVKEGKGWAKYRNGTQMRQFPQTICI